MMAKEDPGELEAGLGSRGSSYLDVLMEEYKAVHAEIIARYRYRYLMLNICVIVVAATLGAVYGSLKYPIVFLVVPLLLFPLMMVELKEHLYIDLRTYYLCRILRPRIEILFRQTHCALPLSDLLGWEYFELRTLKKKWLIYGFLGFMDYGLALGLSIISIIGYFALNNLWNWQNCLFAAISAFFILLSIGIILVFRAKFPHLPSNILSSEFLSSE